MDILDAIDAATGCQLCGGPLGDSPSDDFCTPAHQRAWHQQHVVPLAWSEDAACAYEGADHLRVPLNEPSSRPASLLRFDALADEIDRVARRTGGESVGLFQVMTRPCSTDDCDQRVPGLGLARRCPAHEAEHQRANWRLPRLTPNLYRDIAAVVLAERWASTDSQRAACRVRRQQLTARSPRIRLNVDTTSVTEQFRRIADAFSGVGRVMTVSQPRRYGLSAAWVAVDEAASQAGHVTGGRFPHRDGRQPTYWWTGEPVTVTYDEPYRIPDMPDPPTPAERALQARRNRNTGPPAARMDGRRGRGGPCR